jgi:hypothetical protein
MTAQVMIVVIAEKGSASTVDASFAQAQYRPEEEKQRFRATIKAFDPRPDTDLTATNKVDDTGWQWYGQFGRVK